MLLQITLTLLLALTLARATPPPDYQKNSDVKYDNESPKYKYGYKIGDEYGSQEKQEQRDGIYALGRYYVHGPGSSQSVEYLADNWGFHPYIEYSNVGPHSKSMTQIAFGEEAVKALHNGKNSITSPKLQVEQSVIKYNLENQKAPSFKEKEQVQPQLQQNQHKDSIIIHHPKHPNISAKLQVDQNLIKYNLENQKAQTFEENNPIPTQLIPVDQKQPQDSIIIHRPKPIIDSSKVQINQEQQQTISQNPGSNEQQNVFYVTPHNPHLQQQQQQQQNIVYIPANNYVYATQPNSQPPPQEQINYQNMFFVQVNDYLGQPSLALVPQNSLYDQNIQQNHEQNGNEKGNHNTLLLQNVLQTIETQLKTEQTTPKKQIYLNTNYKTITDYSQKDQASVQANPKYNQNNGIEIQTNDEENIYAPPGAYGTKIKGTLRVQNNNIHTNTREYGRAYKLIAHTKDLVTGQDVLNINQVLDQPEESRSAESSTVQNIIQQYSIHHTLQENRPEVDVSHVGSNSNTVSTTASNSYSPTIPYIYSSTSSPTTASTERIAFISTEAPEKEISLAKDPIVVEDIDENKLRLNSKEYDDKEYFSTTQNTVETAKSVTGFDSTQTTVLVTPRPLSENFLAPINVGVQLQSIEDHTEPEQIVRVTQTPPIENVSRDKVVVEVQKSIPYYLGKFEFVQTVKGTNENKEQLQETGTSYEQYKLESLDDTKHNIDFEKTFTQSGNIIPTPQPLIQLPPNTAGVENSAIEDNRVNENIQSIAYAPNENKGQAPTQLFYQIQPPYQQLILPQYAQIPQFKQINHYQVQNEPISNLGENVDKSVEATKFIDRRYPLQLIPQPIPYPVELNKIVNQQYPVEVNSPQPIHLEKVPIPVEVQVPVPQPYVIEIPKPYPVEVTKLVPQPYPVQVTQTIKVPVPTPVEVKVPHPVAVEVPKYIDRPYPVYISNMQQQFKHNPYQYAPNFQKPIKLHYEYKSQNGDKQQIDGKLQISGAKLQINSGKQPVKNFSYLPLGSSFYHTIHLNDYIGLKPPRVPNLRPQTTQLKPQVNVYTLPRKHRNARHSFGSNIRLEYGFMPPLIPSLEIDENGKPIEKSDI